MVTAFDVEGDFLCPVSLQSPAVQFPVGMKQTSGLLDLPALLTPQTRLALEQWKSMQMLHTKKSFPSKKWKVLTHASLLGWGGVLQNLLVHGTRLSEEQKLPINILVLQATVGSYTLVCLALGFTHKGAVRQCRGCDIHQPPKRDQKSHCAGSLILSGAELHFPVHSAMHIPGVENLAGGFSQGRMSFSLKSSLQTCLRLGTPDVYPLASRFNNKRDRFVSRSKDPQAFMVHALVSLCDPFSLI